ncbi:MAG: hypothetical protein ABSA71_02250 [Desulfomonilia bacterium]|jgi:hypothetical protein
MSQKRSQRIHKKKMDLRDQLWNEIPEDKLWNRKTSDGYTTIPRTLTYFCLIMNHLSSGKPLSSTYMALWHHVFDEAMVTIDNPRMFALESGFTGERAERTWKDRMKILTELGFIEAKPGASGDYNYILILNPYYVVKGLLKKYKEIPQDIINALKQRIIDIGAQESI